MSTVPRSTAGTLADGRTVDLRPLAPLNFPYWYRCRSFFFRVTP